MSETPDRIVATILGCGSSGGVPRIGNNWGVCDPENPRNRRRRCSLLITATRDDSDRATQILIDTGADLREQLLDMDVGHLDAVFYTHAHADHTHGIDDLRVLALANHHRVDVYCDAGTSERLHMAFGYCFEAPPGSGYPPILNEHRIEAGDDVVISGGGGAVTVTPVLQEHGNIPSLGFRIGDLMYSCDVSGFPQSSLPVLGRLKCWIVDALRPVPHPSHLSLPQALDWIAQTAPERAVLTNLHVDMDYAEVMAKTPDNVMPAFDGMQIDVLSGAVLNA